MSTSEDTCETITLKFHDSLIDNNESVEDGLKYLDVDEFFVHIGQFGRTQKFLLLLFYLLMIPHSYHTLSWYFTGHSPAWRCAFLNGTQSECNHTGIIDIGDRLYQSRCLMERSSWTYTKPKEYSIVTEVNKKKKLEQTFS